MAEIFIEGFDKYGPVGLTAGALSASLLQEWTSVSTSGDWRIAAGLSGVGGFSLQNFTNSGLSAFYSRTLPAAVATFFFGVRVNFNLLANECGFQFLSGSTNGFALWVNAAGNLVVGKAGIGGAALATSIQSISAGSTHYIECAVTMSTTGTGSYAVYLDGVLTSLNASSQTLGAASVNVLQLTAGNSGSGIQASYDDIYLFDNTGAHCNNVLLTNPQVNTDRPSSDSAVQFAFGANVLGLPYSFDGGSAASPGANELVLRPFTPVVSCTINSVSLLPGTTSAGANFKPCIYGDTAGAPHTLLSTGSQVTGTTSGTALNLALTTPQALVAGTQYWIGYITDTSINVFESDASNAGFKAANTYTSGAPATAPAMTSGQPSFTIWGNVSGVATNFPQVDEPGPSYGALSFNQSSTVGQQDLLGFPALGGTTGNIYTVKISASLANSDAGARTANLVAKSGGTTSNGSAGPFSPTVGFLYYASYFSTDPNTGSAWGPSGLNAATFGYKVAA